MRLGILIAAALSLSAAPASAGFDSWTVDMDNDPFSGGHRVTVDYSSSIRSGVIIICDTTERGLLVRAIPGFAFDADMQGFEPEVEFAIDGERLLGQLGQTGAVGDNLAIAQTMLSPENARKFVDAFAKAKKQIAIKDGISDRPYLLSARGSTKAGAALVVCMDKQAP